MHRTSWLFILTTLGLACFAPLGCGAKGPTAKAMQGSVTCGGEKASKGMVSFVPIDGTSGRICAAPIVDGQYRFDGGGVVLGKYRVQIDARRKTGRKVKGNNGMEVTMIDEEIRMGPEAYAGQGSPLTVDVRADSDGRFDIAIPSQ